MAQTLATARATPPNVEEDTAPTVSVMRVTPRTGGKYYVLATDLVAAKATHAATVVLCDSAGVPIPATDHTKRSSLPLAIALSGVIESVIARVQRGEAGDRSIPASTYMPADISPQEQQESQGGLGDNPNNTRL